MTYKYAYKIFTRINDTKYTTSEKIEAIYTVVHSDIVNPLSSEYLFNALKWLSEIEPEWKAGFSHVGLTWLRGNGGEEDGTRPG